MLSNSRINVTYPSARPQFSAKKKKQIPEGASLLGINPLNNAKDGDIPSDNPVRKIVTTGEIPEDTQEIMVIKLPMLYTEALLRENAGIPKGEAMEYLPITDLTSDYNAGGKNYAVVLTGDLATGFHCLPDKNYSEIHRKFRTLLGTHATKNLPK